MILYYHNISPPCRAVLMTMKALQIKPEIKIINLFENQHLTPEFVAINQEHMIPVIDDNGFILSESRSIMKYLVLTYGKPNDPLYPSDSKEQAIIDKFLYFDMSKIFQKNGDYIRPIIMEQKINSKYLESLMEGVEFLDNYLNGSDFVAGNKLTLADISLVATISELPAFRIDSSSHKNVVAWLKRCEVTIPGWEENEEGVKTLQNFMDKIFQTIDNKQI